MMTTTYELYTNENGTPKAVEGKAPAILERVENLETSVETAQATADACLPLTGGTLDGAITFNVTDAFKRSSNETGLVFFGGTNDKNGAVLQLLGDSFATNPGGFILSARDKYTSCDLWGQTDGALTWGGKDVITSAGGAFVGNIFGITTNKDFNISADNEGLFNGAQLCLRTKDNSYLSGSWELIARDKDGNSSSLLAQANGTLTWCGHNIMCAAASVSSPGYIKFSNGIAFQWGSYGGAASSGTIYFPLSFDSTFGVYTQVLGGTTEPVTVGVSVSSSYFDFSSIRQHSNAAVAKNQSFLWFAVGFIAP